MRIRSSCRVGHLALTSLDTLRHAAGRIKEGKVPRLLSAIAVSLALAVQAGAVLVGSAGPAAAATSVTCTKVSGNVNTTVIFSKCTPQPGKSAKFNIPATAINNSKATDVWTWAKQPGVNVASSSSALQTSGQNACKTGSVEGVISIGIYPIGDPTGILSGSNYSDSTTMVLCVASSGAVRLYPGRTVDWI
jgi:hypothetical protein